MGIVKNNKNIIAIYRGDKKITSVFKNNKQIFGNSEPVSNENVILLYFKATRDNQSVKICNRIESVEYYEYNGNKTIIPDKNTGPKNIIMSNGDNYVTMKLKDSVSSTSMFEYCTELVGCDLRNVSENTIGTFNSMFNGCYQLNTINMPLSQQNITSFADTFNGCTNLTFIDFTNKINGVSNMSNMFYSCSNLKTIKNIENIDTSNVTHMSNMFYRCENLQELDLSNLNTSNVQVFSSMFENVPALGKTDWGVNYIYGFENWNVSNATNMDNMFKNSYNTTILDLSKWNPTSLVGASSMFEGCSNLDCLRIDNFNLGNLVNFSLMFPSFRKPNRLVFINNDSYNFILNNYSNLNIPEEDANNSYKWITSYFILTYQKNNSIITEHIEYFKIIYQMDDNNHIMVGPSYAYHNASENDTSGQFSIISSYYKYICSLKDNNTTLENMFNNAIDLSNVEGEMISASNGYSIINVNNMFYGCTALTTIPNNLFANAININYFDNTFNGCTSLYSSTPLDNDGTPIYERSNGKSEYVIPSSNSQCFYKCESMPDYSSIPSAWKLY